VGAALLLLAGPARASAQEFLPRDLPPFSGPSAVDERPSPPVRPAASSLELERALRRYDDLVAGGSGVTALGAISLSIGIALRYREEDPTPSSGACTDFDLGCLNAPRLHPSAKGVVMMGLSVPLLVGGVCVLTFGLRRAAKLRHQREIALSIGPSALGMRMRF